MWRRRREVLGKEGEKEHRKRESMGCTRVTKGIVGEVNAARANREETL